MAVVKELIRTEENGAISFGDYELTQKSKLSDYQHQGDMYKVKTFREITKLERNGMFVYESVPGTSVFDLVQSADQMDFHVEGPEDAQITVEMEPDTEYEVFIEQASTGKMKTNRTWTWGYHQFSWLIARRQFIIFINQHTEIARILNDMGIRKEWHI